VETPQLKVWIGGPAMGTLQQNFRVFKKWCIVTVRSIKLIWGASPFFSSVLLIFIPLQGILPAIAIVFSKNIANYLSAILANHRLFVHLYPLVQANVIIWVVLLVMVYLLAPISTAIQGIMNDRLSGYLTLKMMDKTAEFEGIEYFESPTYHDQLEIIRQELAWRPVNLLVFLVNDLRNLVTVISVMALIYTFIPYLVVILVVSMLPQAIASMQLQRSAFEAIVERSPHSRRLQYFANVMLNVEYAKEVRLFNLQSFFIDHYRNLFHSVHLALRKVRLKQAAISATLSILGVCGVGISFYLVVQKSVSGGAVSDHAICR
jgi:ATP-binding cassette subfamily B protein